MAACVVSVGPLTHQLATGHALSGGQASNASASSQAVSKSALSRNTRAMLRSAVEKATGKLAMEYDLGTVAGRPLQSEPAATVSLSSAAAIASLFPSSAAVAAVEITPPQEGLNALWQLADLDPSTAKLLITILGPFFAVSTFLFIIRIIMSWYPQLPSTKFPYVIAYAPTEPILGPTRKLIPPIGGVDVSPVIWLALISFSNEVLLGQQGLLVLLAEKRLGGFE